MRFFDNFRNPDAYYEPNSFGGPKEAPEYREPPLRISGDADHYNHREGNDDYSQPRALFNLFSDGEKQRICGSIAGSMKGVPAFIIERALIHFDRIDPAYGAGIRKALCHGGDAEVQATRSLD